MDRRIFKRFDIDVPAKVDVISDGKIKQSFFCRSYNISAGGIFLNTPERLPLNTSVRIEMVLLFENPEEKTGEGRRLHITAAGRILRCEPTGLIVRFDEDFEAATADPKSGRMIPVHSDNDILKGLNG